MFETKMMNLVVIIVMALQVPICFMMFITVESKKKYKETVKQVVKMLRDDDDDITHTIFTEMLQYLPKEDREYFREQYYKSSR